LVINSEVAAPVRQAGGILTYGIAISVCAIAIRLLKGERSSPTYGALDRGIPRLHH
jgi:hypothetical protein